MANNLKSLYQRAEGAVAYIDESYYSPSSGAGKTFYITAAVVVSMDEIINLRRDLSALAKSGYWHTSEAARYSDGRSNIIKLNTALANRAKAICWIYEPLERSDREGEAARAKSLRHGINELVRKFLPAGGLIVYESRQRGYQENADQRLIGEMRSLGKLDRYFMVHAESPANEPLLWAPDLVAWSYRQEFLGRSSDYFNVIRGFTEVVALNSKSRLP
jgi:hypothetical protein